MKFSVLALDYDGTIARDNRLDPAVRELLRLAEVSAAVAWGSASLKAAADYVVNGDGPADVAAFINSLEASGRLPVPARARRRLFIGHTQDGHEFSLGVRGRNFLIVGDTKSGKSWLSGLLCEQLILQGYCVCVIDPEGDYRTLEALPGVSASCGAALVCPIGLSWMRRTIFFRMPLHRVCSISISMATPL